MVWGTDLYNIFIYLDQWWGGGKAGEEILGMRGNRTTHDDEKLAELSQKQKQLNNEADSCQSKDKRREINKNRNNVMKEIRKRVRYNEDMN